MAYIGFDFTGRKAGERWEYSTRFHLFGQEFGKAHRNYETIRAYTDALEAQNTGIKEPKSTAKQALKSVEGIQQTSLSSGFNGNNSYIVGKLEKCLSWEIAADNAKIDDIKNVDDLRKEIHFILKQSFDKNSANLCIARAQRLILKCNNGENEKVSKNEQRLLLCELTFLSCIYGEIAHTLQTKDLTGSHQYYLADFFLGATAGGAWQLSMTAAAMLVPGLSGAFEGLGHLSQLGVNTSGQILFESAAFLGWIHLLDVSKTGRTKSYQTALGALKTTLSIFTPEIMSKEHKQKEQELVEEFLKEKNILEKSTIVNGEKVHNLNLLTERDAKELTQRLKKLDAEYTSINEAWEKFLGIRRSRFLPKIGETKSLATQKESREKYFVPMRRRAA